MPARNTRAATAPPARGRGTRKAKPPARPEIGSVTDATRKFLEALPVDLGTGPEAAALMCLAGSMDQASSDHARSMCAKEFRELMALLRELAPVEEEPDGIDQLAERRAARRSAA